MDNSLLQSLFEMEEAAPATVSELNADIRAVLERSFANVWVEGEISGFHHASSGHWYFSLTDGDSFIKAACFKGQNFRIRFKPFDGLQVRVRGRLTTYEKRGEYQLLVESLEPVGEGALTVAFEQIKAKLAAEGLFAESRKRKLPAFPRRIGVVTSPTGAALQDILSVLERRARSVSVVIVPTLVQGEFAAEKIAAAIEMANRYCESCADADRLDVLIVGRGGGSAEDLWAFNEERVARAICASAIPVISAVGHEVDFTIADLAADVRAATPSAAAELVAKAESEICERIDAQFASLRRLMENKLLRAERGLQQLAGDPVFARFPARLREMHHRLDRINSRSAGAFLTAAAGRAERLRELSRRLSPVTMMANVNRSQRRLELLGQRTDAAGADMVRRRVQKLENTMATLHAISPLNVLERGYSITQTLDGAILRDAERSAPGDRLRIRLARGKIEAEVKEIEE